MTDLAAKLGVSPSTISRALRNDLRISPKTRERIRKEAARAGFRPDPGAANLVAHRWNRAHHPGTLSVALIRRRGSGEAKRDFPQFQIAATEQGFQLDGIDIDCPQDLVRLPRILRARGLSAGILEFLVKGEEIGPARQVASSISLVISNHRQQVEVAPSVVRDAYHRVQDALREIVARGYTRIGLCLPGQPEEPSEMLEQMQAAYLLAQKKFGSAVNLSLMTYHGEVLRELYPFIQRRKLQVIVDFEHRALQACHRLGLRIPQDIAYASMATRSEEIAGIEDTREKVIHESMILLQKMIRAGQTGSDLATFRQEVRGIWQNAPSLPDLSA